MSVAGNRLVLRIKSYTESPIAISLQLRIWLGDFPGGKMDGKQESWKGIGTRNQETEQNGSNYCQKISLLLLISKEEWRSGQ